MIEWSPNELAHMTSESYRAYAKARARYLHSKPDGYSGHEVMHNADEDYAGVLESRFRLRLPYSRVSRILYPQMSMNGR